MFTVDDNTYELRFTMSKLKVVEGLNKGAVMSELANNNGILSIQLMELLFIHCLVDTSTDKYVHPKQAEVMLSKVVENNGMLTLNAAIVEKLADDLGFMFR